MRKLVLLVLLVTASHIAVSAQETTGTIMGSATDQTGGALPGVTVTITNRNAGVTRTIVTNEAGLYTATLLPVGNYEVAFELLGFQAVTLRGTQWLADPSANGLDNTCTISLTTCNPSNDTFGQVLNARAPREIQLGFKFYW